MLLNSYSFKTEPREHQVTALELSAEKEYFALTMEQGTGKTKVILDNAALLYNAGRLNSLVVIAPNGVHRKWINLELPKHLPDYIPVKMAYWSSTPTKKERKSIEDIYVPGDELRVYTFNTEALSTERGLKEIKRFLNCTEAMLVVDESSRIKNIQSRRTKNILSLRSFSKYRRFLTGTPITQGPLDAFSQYLFLSKDIFDTESFTIFRARYAEIMSPHHPLIKHIMETTGSKFAPVMINVDKEGKPIYKNIDELKALVAPHTFRVLKKDCLDLPPKQYARRIVELSIEQKKLLEDLSRRVKTGALSLAEVSRPLYKLHVAMYAQQILCGICPAPLTTEGVARDIFKDPSKNPRVQALLSEIEETDEQVIVWCRFTADILSITKVLRKEYGENNVVQYFGDVKDDDRDVAVEAFQQRKVRFFVGNPEAAGIGLDLFVGTSVHYYSNSFKLESRLQSEDRSHRIGLEGKVLYTDYEVEGSADTRIIEALMNKKNIADVVTGDDISTWLGAS